MLRISYASSRCLLAVACLYIGLPLDAAFAQTVPSGMTGYNGTPETVSQQVGGLTAPYVYNAATTYFNNANNSYTGITIVTGGATLQIDNQLNLGSTYSLTLNNGTLAFTNGTTNQTTAQTLSTPIILGAGNGTISATGVITTTGTVSTGTTTTTTGGVVASGVISGSGNLTVSGGILALTSNANTYTGTTAVTGGAMLQLSSTYSLYASTVSAPPTVTLNNGTLSNYGGASFTIASPISLGAGGGTLMAPGGSMGYTGIISGTGDLTVSAGTINLANAEAYSGATYVTGGSLVVNSAGSLGSTSSVTVSPGASLYNYGSITAPVTVDAASGSTSGGTYGGSGTLTGLLTNGGTVAPSPNSVLTVSSYTQGSTGNLLIYVNSGGASQLNVTGTSSLGATPTLSLSYLSGIYHAGTYAIYTGPTALAANPFTITGTVASATFAQSFVVNGDSLDLVLTHLSALPDPPKLIPNMTSAAIDEAQQTSQTLLMRLQGARVNAMVDNLNVATNPIHPPRGDSPFGVWAMPTGNTGSAASNNGAPGYTTNGYGFLSGFDGRLAPGIAAGIAVGFSRVNVDQTGGSTGTIDTPRLAAYGGWWKGPVSIDGLASIGYPMFSTSRVIPGAGQTATADHNGHEVSAATQGSLALKARGWVLSPSVGMKYLLLSQEKLAEAGTTIYDVSSDTSNTSSLRPFVQVEVSRRIGITDHATLVPDLRVGYEIEALDITRTAKVQTQGDDTWWQVTGAQPSRDTVNAKIGMTLETSKNAGYYVDYYRQQGISVSGNYSNTFDGGFRYRF